jgi:hypothetical protein
MGERPHTPAAIGNKADEHKHSEATERTAAASVREAELLRSFPPQD